MEATLNLETVADETARLVLRAAAAVEIDPVQQLRALNVDRASVVRVSASVRGTVAALLGCYFQGMAPDDESWHVELWSPAWTRRVDQDVLNAKLMRVVTLEAAAQLLWPFAPLAPAAATYSRQAAEEGESLVRLLDTVTAVSPPPPGIVRRPLHPFV